MRIFTIVFVVFALSLPAFGGSRDRQQREMKTKFHDFHPNDGFLDAGTQQNPYVMKDGKHTYEIKPKYHDFRPGDGFMDAGSPQNPYVMEQKD